MFGMGTTEMVIVGMIALILYGKRLPEVARGLGQSFKQFKDGIAGFETDVKTPFRGIQQTINNTMNSDTSSSNSSSYTTNSKDYEEAPPTAPRFYLPGSDETSKS